MSPVSVCCDCSLSFPGPAVRVSCVWPSVLSCRLLVGGVNDWEHLVSLEHLRNGCLSHSCLSVHRSPFYQFAWPWIYKHSSSCSLIACFLKVLVKSASLPLLVMAHELGMKKTTKILQSLYMDVETSPHMDDFFKEAINRKATDDSNTYQDNDISFKVGSRGKKNKG